MPATLTAGKLRYEGVAGRGGQVRSDKGGGF